MNFEELSGIWNSADLELEKSIKINKELVKKIGFRKVKSRLAAVKWTAIFEIVVGLLFLNFLGLFLVGNLSEPRFFIPALVLAVVTLFGLIFEINRLVLFYGIDSQLAVVEAQKKLIRLKKMEVWDKYSLLVIIPMFSAPFLIVIAKGFADFSLYEFGTSWMLYFTAGSLVVAVIISFILMRFPDKRLIESIEFLDDLKDNNPVV